MAPEMIASLCFDMIMSSLSIDSCTCIFWISVSPWTLDRVDDPRKRGPGSLRIEIDGMQHT